MIVSKEGTVRGIRHRVSKIKMDIMDSLNLVEDRRLIDHEALLESESGQCVVYLTSLGTSQHFSQKLKFFLIEPILDSMFPMY